MSLEEIRENGAEYAQFMEDEIGKICAECGRRDPGSEGERKAVERMADFLKPYADEITIEPFDVWPASFMGWIYISVSLYLLSLIAYFFAPVAALIMSVSGTAIMVLQFGLYRRFVDRLFVKKTSYNLIAVKHPSGEVRRRIFFNGHPDAACEWTFNYYFGGIGFTLHIGLSLLGVAYFLAATIVAVVNRYAAVMPDSHVRILGYVCFAFVPLWIAVYFAWNEKRVVDGANDNLTGCYMGIAVLKALKDHGVTLENTEVGVLLTGSEEAGLRGAKAFCEAHKNDYRDVETIIYAYDTIHDPEFLAVNTRDLNGLVRSDDHAVELFRNAAVRAEIPVSKSTVPFGATDSAAFSQGGFKSAGITAMDHVLQKYYHTREDTPGNLNREGLANCFAATVQTLQDFDEGL